MKVLGATDKGFLIECSDAELCNLMGFDNEQLAPGYHSMSTNGKALKAYKDAKGHQHGINGRVDWVGLILPIAKIYHSARRVAEGWNNDYRLNDAVKNMREFADSLQMIMGTYKPLIKEDEA